MRQLPLGVRLKERANFASFWAGGNRELVARLQRSAAGAVVGATWLTGPLASGRTHLLQAVCHATLPPRRASYLPLADLQDYGVDAVGGSESAEVVCIDDVELVAGKHDWERALFNLYRGIDERCGALVIASAASPGALPWALADLKSRFAAAAVFAVCELDEAQQVEALRLRASLRGLELPDETARYLQRRVPRDMATLAQLLDTFDDASLVAQRRLTVPFVKSVLDARATS
jgi:DnaA family protein